MCVVATAALGRWRLHSSRSVVFRKHRYVAVLPQKRFQKPGCFARAPSPSGAPWCMVSCAARPRQPPTARAAPCQMPACADNPLSRTNEIFKIRSKIRIVNYPVHIVNSGYEHTELSRQSTVDYSRTGRPTRSLRIDLHQRGLVPDTQVCL